MLTEEAGNTPALTMALSKFAMSVVCGTATATVAGTEGACEGYPYTLLDTGAREDFEEFWVACGYVVGYWYVVDGG